MTETKTTNEAIDIMSSDAVAGSGDKHLPALAQTSAWPSKQKTQFSKRCSN